MKELKWLSIVGIVILLLGITISFFTSDTNVCERTCSDYNAEFVDSFFNNDDELTCECDTGLTPDNIVVRPK